jgi:hypothetical protein
MQVDPIVAGAVTVAVHGWAVLGLWLRLRWRVRNEQARGRALVELVEALRVGGGDLDEQRLDGSRPKLFVIDMGEG